MSTCYRCLALLLLLVACSPPDTTRPNSTIEFLNNPTDSAHTDVRDASTQDIFGLEPTKEPFRAEPRGEFFAEPSGKMTDASEPLPPEPDVQTGEPLLEPSPDEFFVVEPPPERTTPEPRPVDDSAHIGKSCKVGAQQGTCKLVKDCTGKHKPVPGFCPGSRAIQCCLPQQSGSHFCDPSKRPQPNTGLKEAPGSGGCPAGMVKVAAFCMDRYEASLVEILSNRQTRVWSPYFNPGNTRVKAVSIKGAVPQGYINGVQAAKACKAAGKRLCTDAEWLRACRGTSNTVYPYGNSRKSRVCNDSRSLHPAVEYFNSSASWVFSKIQHQCLNQLPNGLARSGDYSGCVTKEGVHDLMGNLHEWTSNSTGVFRGGYYVDTYRNGNGCLYRTTAHNTLHWDYSTGFRCCADLPRP